tara:strand:+ start:72 stop:953 length:882 start_codon:yes stop_codon:yes gene_type:complete
MENIFLDFNRIELLKPDECESVFKELLNMRKLWMQRNNWHPAFEITGADNDIESYMHYYTVGAALYMDARDAGWKFYDKVAKMYNRVLWKKLGWLYDIFLENIQKEIGEAEYTKGLGLPGFHIYEFDDATSDMKHHRCLHYDAQWWYGKKFFKDNFTDIDFRNQLSYTFSIKLPHSGAGIAMWNLPKEYNYKANALKNGEDIIEKYENIQYVKEIKKLKNLEEPWKYDEFFYGDGDLGKYIPHVIPHLEGHCFWYHGMVMHQMILGQDFKKGDYRITFQGHALKCDGKWRLWW